MVKLKSLVGLVLLGTLAYSCSSDETKSTKNDVIESVTKPKGLITPQQAEQLSANWDATRAKYINNGRSIPDNRSCWWSLEDMRNYLNYAEQEAKSKGYTMDGIRVYFGAYDSNSSHGKSGEATLFFVPTAMSGSDTGKMLRTGSSDIPNVSPMNGGAGGDPPGGGYQ